MGSEQSTCIVEEEMEADPLPTVLQQFVECDLSAAATAADVVDDDKLAYELQLQEVLVSSMAAMPKTPLTEVVAISSTEEDDSNPATASVAENGESSKSEFDCNICMETKQIAGDGFYVAGCNHVFCRSCIGQYIDAKVEENLTAATIKCPDPDCAAGTLQIEECLGVVPETVLRRWGAAACEAALGAGEKLYCPYKDCSALVLIGDDGKGGEPMRQAECPHCRRIVCAQCRVPWHEGIDCEGFQRLDEGERGREDLMLRQLAGKSKWQRCPKCGFYVEKIDGCRFMSCRCGCCFCYSCASLMSKSDHNCQKCQP